MTNKSHVERLADEWWNEGNEGGSWPLTARAKELRAAIEADREAGWVQEDSVADLFAERDQAQAEVERLRAELDELREENADNWRHLHAARSRAATAEAERDEA